MICVSIGRGRHRHMIAEHRHLAEQGAKLVELRLDYINGAVNIKRLLADRPCAVVITCRRPADGGKWAGTEEQRQLLLRTAIAEGVEYIDLEDDIAAGVPRFGKTKRIVSFHDFRKTPDNLDEIHRRLSQCDADIVKIATMANHPSDNVRILDMVRKAKVPTIGLGMGDIGVPTRILAGKFGAPLTYATFHHERALAPGQLSFEHMTQVYRYEQINAQTEVYGVVADPIGHSLSPLIHNAGLRPPGIEQGLRAVPRAPRGFGPLHRRGRVAGHPRFEHHHSAQGRSDQEAHQGRRGGPGHRSGQHGGAQRSGADRLQHRLSCRHVEPGRGHGAVFGAANDRFPARRPW